MMPSTALRLPTLALLSTCKGQAEICVQAAEEAERGAAQKLAAEHRQKLSAAQHRRQKQTKLMRKKTRSGQPVMKHRLDSILDKLEAEAS